MRHYETVFILVPDLPDEERTGIIDRYKSVITDSGGDLLVIDEWGRRRLAYEIMDFNKGHYVLFEHASDPSIISELERQMRLDDQVLRYLTIKLEETFDKAAYEAEHAVEEPETVPEAVAEPETKPEPEAEAEAKPETKAEPEPEAEAKPETKPEPEPEAEAKAETKPEPEPEAEAKAETKPEPEEPKKEEAE